MSESITGVEKRKRLDNISLIKTLMMISVVLYHSLVFFQNTWFTELQPIYKADYLSEIATWMSTFHVQTFTAASGFLFYYLENKESLKNNIKKRVKRLLFPYVFTCLLWAMPIGYYFSKYSLSEIIRKFVLMEAPAQLWFLIMLFLVYVFFELIGKKIKISTKNLIILYFITTMVYMGLSYLKIRYFQLPNAAQHILYFYLGGFIFHNKQKTTKKQVLIMTVMAALMYTASLFLGASSIQLLNYAATAINPIISVFEVSIIYYVCTKLVEKKKVNIHSKAYKLLEGSSFGIYIFHQQIIYFTILFLNGAVHPIIQVALSFTISLTVSLIMTLLLKKWKPTRIMFGL